MRKMLQSGLVGALLGATLLYLATGYGSRPGCPVLQNPPAEAVGASSGEAQEFVAALLPDPAKLTADWQPFETIDLLRPQPSLTPPPWTRLAERPFPESMVPAAVVRSAEEAECLRLPPCAEPIERLTRMPCVEEAAEPRPLTNPQAIQERLQGILQSYLSDSQGPARAEVDTMEFRPSDAKKGEFAARPF